MEWVLYTDEPTEALAAALVGVMDYATRPLIEEWHKGLKTGLKVEELQLETGHRLFAATAVMSIVALRLLDMIEGENFFGLDDFILPPEKVEVRRIIEVALPGRDKKIVTYDAPNSSEFERIAGAVALVAAIASRGGTQPSREVADASLQYAYLSSKPGAGDQEIHLGGDGNVKLLFRKTANDPAAEVREMSGGQNTFAALWDLFEQERFLTLPDYQSTGRARVLRSIKFSRGSQTRELYAEGIDDPAFERLAGAIKLAAGILLPEALNQRFFPNL